MSIAVALAVAVLFLFVWYLPATAATFTAAGKLGLSRRGWALIPIVGDSVTLARCAKVSPWVALLLPIPLAGWLLSWKLWQLICEDSHQSRWLGYATIGGYFVPVIGAVPMWVIAIRLPRIARESPPLEVRALNEAPVKRGERSRWLPPAWVLSVLATLAIGAGFLVADHETLHWYSAAPVSPTPTLRAAASPEPDRVVGLLRVCERGRSDPLGRFGAPPVYEVLIGPGCATVAARRNDRLDVTVRTPVGGSYVVTVAGDALVAVGDPWPPP